MNLSHRELGHQEELENDIQEGTFVYGGLKAQGGNCGLWYSAKSQNLIHKAGERPLN